jgi:hypothetical protein
MLKSVFERSQAAASKASRWSCDMRAERSKKKKRKKLARTFFAVVPVALIALAVLVHYRQLGLESGSFSAAPEPVPKLARFVRLGLSLGARLPGTVVAQSPFGGLGVFATAAVPRGADVVCAPESIFLSRENMVAHAPRAVSEAILGARGTTPSLARAIFAVWLSRLSDDEVAGDRVLDFWREWVRSWPDGEDIPRGWPLAKAKVFGLPIEVTEFREQVALDTLERLNLTSANLLDRVRTMEALVCSREYGPVSLEDSKSPDVHRHSSLIPFLDLINHDPNMAASLKSGEIRSWKHKNNTVCLGAARAYRAGDEVFSVYSDEPIGGFYPKYGFVHDDPSTDTFLFWFPLAKLPEDGPQIPRDRYLYARPNGDKMTYNVRGSVPSIVEAFLPWVCSLAFSDSVRDIRRCHCLGDEFSRCEFTPDEVRGVHRLMLEFFNDLAGYVVELPMPEEKLGPGAKAYQERLKTFLEKATEKVKEAQATYLADPIAN